ncbi:unnamed protein product [Eruca vesicaria subsp. sativa]|uniref:Uncharacterized protein n=1 Tax=Eruca vesicaria subsp. sativa TaxID=29727 RepID=A0ABC8M170_ERUVS|nr:unnamed protein product [Eruca vesicaria subsp. sativa]
MADKEMQLQDVPCEEADDVLKAEPEPLDPPPSELLDVDGHGKVDDVLKGEPSEPDKDQNMSEPLPLEDNDGHGNTGELLYSRKKSKVSFLSPQPSDDGNPKKRKTWLLTDSQGDDEAGTPEEQQAFLRELDTFHRENYLDYKPLKFYQKPLNTLKLWRAVTKLGGHEVVTTLKLWRQVGESFDPPKTCTTISYTFRNFYEKALLEYEKYKRKSGELNLPGPTVNLSPSLEKEVMSQGSGSGRARRDSAARAMQGWQAHRLDDSGEVTEHIDMGLNSTPKHKKLKNIGKLFRKALLFLVNFGSLILCKRSVADVIDDGPLADWVKITVKETKESFEVFALVPGLLRNEIRIQSDPAGRLIITGEPEQLDNPWGITPFKKIVVLPARIDPHHTNAIMSMHGRLFIRAQYEKLTDPKGC